MNHNTKVVSVQRADVAFVNITQREGATEHDKQALHVESENIRNVVAKDVDLN